jgi:hypothetical protein
VPRVSPVPDDVRCEQLRLRLASLAVDDHSADHSTMAFIAAGRDSGELAANLAFRWLEEMATASVCNHYVAAFTVENQRMPESERWENIRDQIVKRVYKRAARTVIALLDNEAAPAFDDVHSLVVQEAFRPFADMLAERVYRVEMRNDGTVTDLGRARVRQWLQAARFDFMRDHPSASPLLDKTVFRDALMRIDWAGPRMTRQELLQERVGAHLIARTAPKYLTTLRKRLATDTSLNDATQRMLTRMRDLIMEEKKLIEGAK